MEQKLPDQIALYIRSMQMEADWEKGLKQQVDELAEYDSIEIPLANKTDEDSAFNREIMDSIQQELAAKPELTENIHTYKHEEAKAMYGLLSEENGNKPFKTFTKKA